MSERLRRLIRNQLGFACVGSSPAGVAFFVFLHQSLPNLASSIKNASVDKILVVLNTLWYEMLLLETLPEP